MSKSIKRGQVWFYRPSTLPSGSIQGGARPVIIVSNDVLNKTSSVVLGVPCTTQIKRNFPTHALFIMNRRVSVALAEQVMPINVEHLTTLEYILEDYTMKQVDQALMSALALDGTPDTRPHDTSSREPEVVNNSVENVDKKPMGNQIEKFYRRCPQLAPSERYESSKWVENSKSVKWTEQKASQLVKDIESISDKGVLEKKYGLSYQTLRRYYYTFRNKGK